MNYLKYLSDWSEVWILIFPFIGFLSKRNQPAFMKPVFVYLWIAFLCNIICDGMWLVLDYIPKEFRSNTVFYNIHSLSRFTCFAAFFLQLKQKDYQWLQKILIILFSIITLFYFSFIDSFFNKNYISSDMMSGESFFLLFFCMLYYLSILKSDIQQFSQRKDFWIITGISIFSVINFFIFLFYQPLLIENRNLAEQIWTLHNIAFIIFIIFITKAIYVPHTNKH